MKKKMFQRLAVVALCALVIAGISVLVVAANENGVTMDVPAVEDSASKVQGDSEHGTQSPSEVSGTKPSAKDSGKAVAEPGAAPETKPTSKPGSSSGSAPETKPSPKPESSNGFAPETKPTSKPESPNGSAPETKPTSKPESPNGSAPETKPTPKPESSNGSAPETKPTPKPESTAEPGKKWVVDVPGHYDTVTTMERRLVTIEEVGHWEDVYYTEWVYRCNQCGYIGKTEEEVWAHQNANWDWETMTGCGSYTMISGDPIYTGEQFWVVDEPKRVEYQEVPVTKEVWVEEVGHWE